MRSKETARKNATLQRAEFQSSETGIVDGIGTEDEIFAKIRSLVSILPENNRQMSIPENARMI